MCKIINETSFSIEEILNKSKVQYSTDGRMIITCIDKDGITWEIYGEGIYFKQRHI